MTNSINMLTLLRKLKDWNTTSNTTDSCTYQCPDSKMGLMRLIDEEGHTVVFSINEVKVYEFDADKTTVEFVDVDGFTILDSFIHDDVSNIDTNFVCIDNPF